jgi:hypothetical protein
MIPTGGLMRRRLLFVIALLLAQSLGRGVHAQKCPTEGDGGDPQLNELKNRTNEPKGFESVAWTKYAHLRVPQGVSKALREKWPEKTLDLVAEVEKRAISLKGYLVGAKLMAPERCNCGAQEQEDRDFHIWLAKVPHGEKATSIVVEITPRLRAHHPNWTVLRLNHLAKWGSTVRVSGWAMLDPEHPSEVGKSRVSIWEIHPILRIEWWEDGQWHDLDEDDEG